MEFGLYPLDEDGDGVMLGMETATYVNEELRIGGEKPLRVAVVREKNLVRVTFATYTMYYEQTEWSAMLRYFGMAK